MNTLDLDKLQNRIQSSQLNFLLGAGASRPFLPLLNNIEQRLNAVEKEKRAEILKEYLSKVMLPNLCLLDSQRDSNFLSSDWNKDSHNWLERSKEKHKSSLDRTTDSYLNFLKSITRILLERKSTILGKQVNIFTTNIDIFIEHALETLGVDYNDGFSGRLSPTFNIANYKKSFHQRSVHFHHLSDIPMFSVVKLHGSLTWKYSTDKEKIEFSSGLDSLDKKMLELEGDEFLESYDKLVVVNPEETKHLESVLNVYYYELLRLFSSELEKENSLLFIVGFSMGDKHVREIVLRSAQSNPTLQVYIFCHSNRSFSEMKPKIDTDKYQNVKFVKPVDDDSTNRLSLGKITEVIFKNIPD